MDICSKNGRLLLALPADWDTIFNDSGLLVGRNLDHADVSGIDLGNADARGASFVNANLYQAFLNRANLSGANFEGADLRGADLEDADLRLANLKHANFGRSNIGTFTRLEGADLRGALCEGANFLGALYDDSTKFPDGFDPRSRGMETRSELDGKFRDWGKSKEC